MVKHVRGETGAHRVGDDAVSDSGVSGWRTGPDGSDDLRWFSYWDERAFDDALALAQFRILGGSTDDAWLRRLALAE
jgi:hypothetical protein